MTPDMNANERFAIEKKGTVYNNIVDRKQPKTGGPGIIAISHSDGWAQLIAESLNYCATTGVIEFPIPTPIPTTTPTPQPKEPTT